MNRQLWTIKDTAAFLNVAEKTVHRMLQREELPAVRVGNQWRFAPDVVESWVAANVESGNAGPPGIGGTIREMLSFDPHAVPLDRLVGEDGIVVFPASAGDDQIRSELVDRLVKRYPEIDMAGYVRRLKERDAIASVDLGYGVCAPHVRNVEENPVDSADIILALRRDDDEAGNEAAIPDGPCHLTALVVSDDLVIHLRLLQKISALARAPGFDRLLAARTPLEALGALITIERRNT